jgi:hypothetical protein
MFAGSEELSASCRNSDAFAPVCVITLRTGRFAGKIL